MHISDKLDSYEQDIEDNFEKQQTIIRNNI